MARLKMTRYFCLVKLRKLRRRIGRELFPTVFSNPFSPRIVDREFKQQFIRDCSSILVLVLGLSFIPATAYATPPSSISIGTIVGANGYLEVPFSGGTGATSIEYSVDDGISWNTRYTGLSGGSTATWSPITIDGLENDKTYSVKLRARNSSGVVTSSTSSGTPQNRTQIYNLEGFLQGRYVEVGIRSNGAFGSTLASNTTLTGLHLNSNSAGCLGFRVDRQKNGWGSTTGSGPSFVNIDDGDYFCPGTPYEGWGLQVGSATAFNAHSNQTALAGVNSNMQISSTQQSIDWSTGSTLGGIKVSQTAIVPTLGQSLHIDVTLTNASNQDVNGIYYVRGFDPDNATGSSAGNTSVAPSINEVVSVGGGSTAAEVKATFDSGALIMIRSTDSRARAARNTANCCTNSDAVPINVYNGSGNWTQSLGPASSLDRQLAISFNIGTLTAGASTTFRVSYVLSASEASSPSVTTGSATGVGATNTATLNGLVNANGQSSDVQFQLGTTSDLSGTITRYTAVGSPASGASNTEVSVLATGLNPGTTYFYRVVATNDTGTSNGTIRSFTPIASPTISINAADNIGDSTARLNGTISANGGTVGSIYFTFSPTSNFSPTSTIVPATTSAVSSGSAVSVSTSLSGLSPGATYFFKLTGTNEASTASSSSLSFTTTPAPFVSTGSAISINPTAGTAILNAAVNVFSVATGTAYFQLSSEITFPSLSTQIVNSSPSSFSSGSLIATSGIASGLSVGYTYFFRYFASNQNGSNYGSTQSFALIASPTVSTGSAATSGTTATLTGSINSNGDPTTSIRFYYATSAASIGSSTAYVTSSPTSVSGSSNTSVTATISGLTAGSTYFYQLRASNSSGSTSGSVSSFTLAAADTTQPTVAISTASTASKNSSIIATITFSEAVTGFTSSDLLLAGSSGGWTKGSPSTSDNTVFTIEISPTSATSAGSLTLNINAGAVTDTSGNTSLAATSIGITITDTSTVPNPPRNISATVTGDTTAILYFSAPSSNGGSTITSYSYVISSGSAGTVSAGSSGFPSSGGSGSFSVSGLTQGTTYTFSVFATNSNGNSSSVSSPAITTTVPATVPLAPTIGVLTATSATTATLTYTAGSNGGSTIVSFTAGSGSVTFVLLGSNSGTFNLTGLIPNTAYAFSVYATNAIGDSIPSASSNTITMPSASVASSGSSLLPGLLPQFAPYEPIQNGFKVQITNHDSSYQWTCSVALPFECSISSQGLINVSGGTNSGTEVLVRVITSRSGHADRTNSVIASTGGLGIDKELVVKTLPTFLREGSILTIKPGTYNLRVNGWQLFTASPEATSVSVYLNGALIGAFSTNESVYASQKVPTQVITKPQFSLVTDGIVVSMLPANNSALMVMITAIYSNCSLTLIYRNL